MILRQMITMERLLEDILLDAPEMGERTMVIDRKYVDSRLQEVMEDEDLSRFIL